MNDDTMLSGIGKEFATLDPLFKQHGWYTSKMRQTMYPIPQLVAKRMYLRLSLMPPKRFA